MMPTRRFTRPSWSTTKAGGKVDSDNPTQFGRAMGQLGIEMIPAYSPEARGRSERVFGTLQARLPKELADARVTEVTQANRFLRRRFLPALPETLSRTNKQRGRSHRIKLPIVR